MKQIESALLKTILYADIFDFPLKIEEVWRYLIIATTAHTKFQYSLFQLIREKMISAKDGYYVLPHRLALIQNRQQRTIASQKKLVIARRIARFLSFIPSVWAVLVTGSAARYNADDADDIDFLIITAPHTLWLTRLLSVLLLDSIGIRRKPHDTHVQDKICLNMFMDASHLSLPRGEEDLYSAYEVVQCLPLVNRFDIFARFLKENRWIKAYLPHAIRTTSTGYQTVISAKGHLFMLEQFVQRLQLWKMRNKRTSEVINSTMLRFHPVDARSWVREAYITRLKKYHLRETNEFCKTKS